MQRWLQQVLNSTASTAHVVRRGGMLVVLASVLVTGTDLCKEKPAPGTSLVVLRSPSDDLVQNRHYHAGQFTNCRPRDYFRVAYKFQQSIHGDRFAQSLFGSDRLQFLGSKFKDGEEMPNNLPTKDETGIYADYFGLAPETNATLVFRPRVQNNVIHFILHLDLCDILNGLYVHLDAPIVNSRWQLRQSTQYCYAGNGSFQNQVPRAWLVPGLVGDVFDSTKTNTLQFANYLYAPNVETLQLALSGQAFGKVAQWNYGRFFGNDEDTTRLAAFNADLGYSAYDSEDMHLGVYFKVSAPSGTHRGQNHAHYIFAPTVGDPFWKIGAGITGHMSWFDECHDQSITLLAQAYLTRWGHAIEWRTMDFKKNGPLSRYLMLKEFWYKDFDDQSGDPAAVPSTLVKNVTTISPFATGNMLRATEYTTRRVKVGVEMQGEGLIECVYRHGCGFSMGLGYNVYGKSGENVELCKRTESAIDKKPLGITSGIDQVIGFQTKNAPPAEIISVPFVPNTQAILRGAFGVQYLTATQSDATLYNKGTTDGPGVDYHQSGTGILPGERGYVYLIYQETDPVDGTALTVYQDRIAQLSGTVTGVFQKVMSVDNPPTDKLTTYDIKFTPAVVPVTLNDLDVESAQLPGYVTNKFFGHMGYEWADCDSTPYVHGGFEAEFAPDKYPAAFLSAWAVYLTGGLSF